MIAVGDVLYRVEWVSADKFECHYSAWTVDRLTPCGMWLRDRWGEERWRVRHTRFASRTKHDARKNYFYRKKAAHSHAKRRYLDARRELELARVATGHSTDLAYGDGLLEMGWEVLG